MSGFEVAGVILGTIPLIISALEHYEKTHAATKTWRYYRREIHSITKNLEHEQIRLQNACESLIDGLGLTSQMESLVDDLSNPAWREHGVQEKITARLGRSYKVFEANVHDINKAVEDVKMRLDLQSDGKIGWLEGSLVTRELKRAAFVLKRSNYADLMTTIENRITKIENAIHSNIDREPRRALRSQGKLITIVRDVSGSMYRALKSSFPCGCSHKLHLSLNLPSKRANHESEDATIQRLEFQLVVTNVTGETSSIHARREEEWKEEILVRLVPKQTLHKQETPNNPQESPKQSGLSRKTVTFATLKSTQHETSETVCQQSATFKLIRDSFGQFNSTPAFRILSEDLDLCQKICQSQKQPAFDCYGTTSDRTLQSPRSFSVHPTKFLPQNISDGDIWSVVSLQQILDQPHIFPKAVYSVKLQLATVISSGFLQLHQTPWLPQFLTSREIFFFHKGPEVQYHHPFVVRSLPERTKEADTTQPLDSVASGYISELRSLGILLLESNLGQTFESLREKYKKEFSEAAIGQAPYFTEDAVLDSAMSRRADWNGNYADVVRLCLWGHGDSDRKLDLNDENFRQEIYERVVASLEADMQCIRWTFSGRA